MASTKGAKTSRASVPDTKPYGDPMRDAIASGSLAQMKRLEKVAVKWIDDTKAEVADVQAALRQMRAAMKKVRP